MKYLLIALFLTASTSLTTAQIVNIPDGYFLQNLLSAGVDTNNDSLIQESEALAVTGLSLTSPQYCYMSNGFLECQSRPILNLTGIRAFTNLQTLYINNEYENPFDNPSQDGLDTIDLAGLSSLRTLEIVNTPLLRKIILSGCTNIETLKFGQNNNAGPFQYMSPGSLDLSNFVNLQSITCFMASFSSLDLLNCTSLKSIYMFEGGYPAIMNLSTVTNLETIELGGAGGSSSGSILDFSNLSRLKSVNLWGSYGAPMVYFTNCTALKSVTIENVLARQLSFDFSTCSSLTSLGLLMSSNISRPYNMYIYLKNGVTTGFNLYDPSFNNTNSLLNICADDFEIQSIRQDLARNSFTGRVNINSYCSFYPGGHYNTIAGKLRIDDNNNGCDNTDRQLVNVPVKFTDTTGQTVTVFSNITGDYSVYTYKGLFSFMPYLPYPYFNLNPPNAVVSFDTANSLVNTTDFCLHPSGVHNDLEINFLPNRGARPGFNTSYVLTYRNRGNTTMSGVVTINYDNNRMNFVSASQSASSQTTGQLAWNYNNLLPLETRTINVTFNLLPPPVNNINDTISYLASITPVANDETAFDNSFILPQRITGSFDPNDKQCLEGSKLDISKIGEYLHYHIRFQNEGTDTAFFIVVADTLSNNLDWNTFEFIASSHTCYAKRTNNKLEFYFQDINLPYKAIDEPGSNGWIAFKIKPRNSVVVGDSINNKAAIYFDFNLPVITNTATTIIISQFPVPVKLEYFSASKKDNGNLLNWKASCTYGNATFVIERSSDGIHFSSIGNISATTLRCQLPFNFTDNNPAAGKNYYRIKITDADGKSFYSKVLLVGNNKAGIEITAVANNIVYLNSNKQQTITMKVIAADGKVVYSSKETVVAGKNSIRLYLPGVTPSFNTLVMYPESGEIHTKKFISN